MRTTMGLAVGLAVGLAAFLAGCDDQVREQMESEVKTLQARCEALKREGDAANASVDRLMAENAALERKQYGLGAENDSLKKQVEAERVAAAKSGVAVPSVAADTAPSTPGTSAPAATANAAPAPGTPPAPVRDEQAIKEAERSVADLQSAITPIQARVNQGKSKILSIIRATIDVPMIPPAGGVVRGGQIYSLRCTVPSVRWIIRYSHMDAYGNLIQDRVPVYHTHDDSCYQPIGPAVKVGDYRTVLERTKAIETAKEANLPLAQELKSLQDELAAAKAKLANLRAGQ